MLESADAVEDYALAHVPAEAGLRANILSPTETLAQSISAIAPTGTPAMNIPLVFALSGNGTWLAYVLAMVAVLLIAMCIAEFARRSSCSGSLYTYATSALPPLVSGVAGWGLLLAYVATGASVTGGFVNYAQVLLLNLTGHSVNAALLALVSVGTATLVAYFDVQISARLMLWIEAASVFCIVCVLVLVVWRTGFHLDHAQTGLEGMKRSSIQLGIVLALFSFVGFESATALGAEAKNPLRTIPRAVVQSAFFTGVLFVVCAYVETLGMAQAHEDLATSSAPFHVLAKLVGAAPFGALIDMGAVVSMFACTLACITAGARVLLRMASEGIVHTALARTHVKNATPHLAVLLIGLLTLLPVGTLAAREVRPLDIFGWMGSLAVYGFLTTYGLAVVALPFYLKRVHTLSFAVVALSIAALLAILMAMAGTVYPWPEWPYNWLPGLYVGYLAVGVGWQWFVRRRDVESVA